MGFLFGIYEFFSGFATFSSVCPVTVVTID
jgi:hypothetical protein